LKSLPASVSERAITVLLAPEDKVRGYRFFIESFCLAPLNFRTSFCCVATQHRSNSNTTKKNTFCKRGLYEKVKMCTKDNFIMPWLRHFDHIPPLTATTMPALRAFFTQKPRSGGIMVAEMPSEPFKTA
jgi:hypothetical protein